MLDRHLLLKAIYDEMQRAIEARVGRFLIGNRLNLAAPTVGTLPPTAGGTGGTQGVTIRGASDYDNSVAPADGQAVTWSATSGKFHPVTPTAPGMTDPETTPGDLIYRNGANITSRLPIGTTGAYLQVSGSPALPVWGPAPSGGSGGGGAPTTSQYVLGATDATLTNGIIIPGLAGTPDLSGAAGGGSVSEEYDTTTTGLTWTTAPATVDSNTTRKSHLYVKYSTASRSYGLRAWTPGNGVALDIRAHISLGALGTASWAAGGLCVTDSGGTNHLFFEYLLDTFNTLAGGHWPLSVWSDGNGSFTRQTQSGNLYGVGYPVTYQRLTRDTANNWQAWLSHDGKVWQPVTAVFTWANTVAKVGYAVNIGSTSAPLELVSDWLRTNV